MPKPEPEVPYTGSASKLLGQTVEYRFNGVVYTGEVISAGTTLFTVYDERGYRRVLHISAIVRHSVAA